MKRILVINGPNLNLLGVREPDVYGSHSYDDLVGFIMDKAASLNLDVRVLQSNHEGAIVDMIQQALDGTDAIVINPAAYTHTSVAILDALKAVGLPTVEVHLSDINCREEFRRFSYVSLYAEKTISGMGFDGYAEALEYLAE
ncbi:MAG: type II 3-dehydroquinate dehydratase [Bacteroidetes bacterium]|nr:type II 3-dehydroquinate dehydratase [Candidatus Colenecus caballi]